MKRAIPILVVVALALAGVGEGGELEPGETLSQENWESARDLLPPEMLRHYEHGEYANGVMAWENGRMKWSTDFVETTRRNADQLALDDKGSIVEKAGGRHPPYMRGIPFPNVTRDDPQGGIKILWNHFLYWWNNGNIHNFVRIHWVSPSGVERTATQDVYFLYYHGQPRVYVPPRNPDDLLVQFLANTLSPADLNGTAALSWRFRDPGKRDANWAYVPALRRVRAVSPTNRSDGFLGSDMSQDDAHFFDGKPEDFVWTVKGEEDVLRLADPFSLNGEFKRLPAPGGGWRGIFKRMPMVGFQDPAWKGSPWAPINFVLARRRCWVIEGVPKDKYYLYGRIQLYVDKETYHGSYNRKFDWKGNLLNTYNVFADLNGAFEDGDYYGAGNIVYQGAENLKLNRATVMSAPQDGGDPANDRRIRLEPAFFDAGALVRVGK
jgi:hypothetical protein